MKNNTQTEPTDWEDKIVDKFAQIEYVPDNPGEGRTYTYGQIPYLNSNFRQTLDQAIQSERKFWQDRVKKLDRRIEQLTKCDIKIKDEVFK
jgi:hypothetical protein